MKRNQRAVAKTGVNAAQRDRLKPSRNAIAEWAVTILFLLFGTTTLCQAFVIPTGSMETRSWSATTF